ncbi:uncharacterized protein LOC114246531 isoform X2 [Bombyx mandarina]|uniref:CUE domain-containing protein n=2 Tax=Bombyx TaxID=7090 RepID=A0A8R2QWZ3_BOMMO|nr:uncharacterized protein LOC114246531 isoform X2 [Bombyx mandarina]XP_037870175.1 uncharacterized protein LOC105841890 isoform X2 [Bombyx mori]
MEENKSKHKTLQNAAHHIALDCIQPQTTHGSPYHVHPYPSPVRLQHAFQAQSSPKLFHPKGLKPHLDARTFATPQESPVLGRALCLTPRGSPIPGRVSHLNEKFQDSLTLNSDTDSLVAKISAMFPTVSETHIKILLKKYYNREAVVISALQVEKHPLVTPGPHALSPPGARLQRNATSLCNAMQFAKGISGSLHGSSHYTPMTGTPQGSPSLLRPGSGASSYYGTARNFDRESQPARHPSPKMKLKYLKSVFPKADETIIIDVLANKDNNVQKASEELIGLGYVKKDISAQQKKKDIPTPQPIKKVVIMKTNEEKQLLKRQFELKYPWIPERLIIIALESVDFNEDRAHHILSTVSKEEATHQARAPEVQMPRRFVPDTRREPILKTNNGAETKYKSPYCSQANGPNPTLRRGPRESLLLEDYMPWNGPNPEYRAGNAVRVEGPEYRDVTQQTLARGPSGTANGPAGLARGSMYQKSNKKTTKIVI